MRLLRAGPLLAVLVYLSIIASAPAQGLGEGLAAEPGVLARVLDQVGESVAASNRLVAPFFTDADARADDDARRFREAVALAVAEHPTIQASALGERQARAAIAEERGQLFPQVALGAEGRQSLTTSDVTSQEMNPALVLSITQLLYDFGATTNRIAAAQAREVGQRFQSLSDAQYFALDAISAYLDVARLRAHVALADQDVERHRMLADALAERAASGAGNRADVVRAEGRVAEARARLIDRQAEAAIVEASYIDRFGRAPDHDDLPTVAVSLPGHEEAVAALEARNPDLQRAEAEHRAAEEDAEAARAERWPTFRVELTGRQFARDDPVLGSSDLAFMLRGTLNLYSGGSEQARRERTAFRAAQARQEMRATRRDLERQLLAAFAEVRSRRLRLEADRAALEAEEAAFLAALDLFTIGRRSLSDVLDTQRDLYNAASSVLDNRVQLDLSRYVVLALAGELLTFFEVEEPADAR